MFICGIVYPMSPHIYDTKICPYTSSTTDCMSVMVDRDNYVTFLAPRILSTLNGKGCTYSESIFANTHTAILSYTHGCCVCAWQRHVIVLLFNAAFKKLRHSLNYGVLDMLIRARVHTPGLWESRAKLLYWSERLEQRIAQCVGVLGPICVRRGIHTICR